VEKVRTRVEKHVNEFSNGLVTAYVKVSKSLERSFTLLVDSL
jgi:hypothetical protein